MKHHISIDEETMAVLRKSEVSASSVKLPPGQLPRPLYAKVNKVLETAGGKWNKSAQSHTFTQDPRDTLGLAVASGAIKDTKRANQAFYTPPEVAATVVQLASVDGKSVLEPSAGHGALALECVTRGGAVTCIELDPASIEVLQNGGFRTLCGDFLSYEPGKTMSFERVVMNPPFENGKDIAHVTHAFSFLKPGGRLVSIMSPSWLTKEDKKSVAFRAFLNQFGHVAEHLDAGAFKASGTNIATVVVILDKPAK